MRRISPTRSAVSLFDRMLSLPGIGFIYAMTSLVSLLGHRRSLAVGRMLGDFCYAASSRMRTKVVHNLRLAYGDELQRDAAEKLARTVLQNFWNIWIELFFVAGPRKAQLLDAITIRGREHLDRALAKGRGVIGISAHLGTYPLVGTKLAREGYNFRMVVRDFKTAAGSLVYDTARAVIDLPSLATKPEKTFYREALRILKNNGILGMIADENKRRGGIFVDFFGRPASTAPGPAALALRTGAAIVPMFIMRTHDQTPTLFLEPEIPWSPTGNDEQDMFDITSRFTRVIEDYVRRDPSQWVWTNWRWRTQPWGQSAEAKVKRHTRFKAVKKRLRIS